MSTNQSVYFTNVEDYFTKVDVYSKIVRNNYMFHKEIFSELKSFLDKHYKNKSFKLLDLGCGNAFFMAQVLKDTRVELYTAYDLSSELVEEAKNNMKVVNCQKVFIVGDISKDFFSSNLREQYDIIWSSYALHHLSWEDKIGFIKACYKRLKEKSHLIIVDFVNDYNSREECMKVYNQLVEKNWTILTEKDKKYLYDHVLKFDFPESFEKYKEIADKAGFKSSKKVFQYDSWAFMIFEN